MQPNEWGDATIHVWQKYKSVSALAHFCPSFCSLHEYVTVRLLRMCQALKWLRWYMERRVCSQRALSKQRHRICFITDSVPSHECMETWSYTCLRARCVRHWGRYTVYKVVNATQDKEWNRWLSCLAISNSITEIYYRVWASHACQSFVPAL